MSLLDKIFSLLNKNKVLLKESSEKSVDKAIFNDQVYKAFVDFVRLVPDDENWVIIGGIAAGVYSEPRNTQDIDVAVLNKNEANILYDSAKSRFTHNRPSAMEYKSNGVEVEILTPDKIKQSEDIIEKAIKTSNVHNVNGKNVLVVNPKFLIALKLKRALDKGSKPKMDQSDIIKIIETYGKIDLSDLNLPEDQMGLYDELAKEVV